MCLVGTLHNGMRGWEKVKKGILRIRQPACWTDRETERARESCGWPVGNANGKREAWGTGGVFESNRSKEQGRSRDETNLSARHRSVTGDDLLTSGALRVRGNRPQGAILGDLAADGFENIKKSRGKVAGRVE